MLSQYSSKMCFLIPLLKFRLNFLSEYLNNNLSTNFSPILILQKSESLLQNTASFPYHLHRQSKHKSQGLCDCLYTQKFYILAKDL